jgi:hypothetical protein
MIAVDIRQIIVGIESQMRFRGPHSAAARASRAVDGIYRIDQGRRQPHLAGFDLRHVENVVDHLLKVLGGLTMS